MKNWTRFALLSLFLAFFSCQKAENNPPQISETMKTPPQENPYQAKPYVQLKHPEWSKNATIYEVNVRQFTPEGTFKAFEAHLPRLKELGVDIIWLMPIHPIGEKNRKGKLGSYYSVRNYYGVNPDFGTMEEFKSLVKKIHALGMFVILDWVANHSAWDNPLATEHPEWYSKTPEGNFQPTPWYDWEDIIDFDYEQEGIRKYMTEALKFWVKEADIDGYRCDVAGFMPTDFWDNARKELDQIKPVFMLAEWESRDLHRNAFDMTYAWSLWDKLHAITTKKQHLGGLNEYMAHHVSTFPKDGFRMTFTDNHDKNSWEGNQMLNFGAGLEASIVFCCTVEGVPLIYSGQEAGLDRSLAFFEKDEIKWEKHPIGDLFQKLFKLKHENQALWNGAWGGEMIKVQTDNSDQIIAFSREKNGDKVLTVINFTDKRAKVKLKTQYHKGNYSEFFSGKPYEIQDEIELNLEAWKYAVLVKKKN